MTVAGHKSPLTCGKIKFATVSEIELSFYAVNRVSSPKSIAQSKYAVHVLMGQMMRQAHQKARSATEEQSSNERILSR